MTDPVKTWARIPDDWGDMTEDERDAWAAAFLETVVTRGASDPLTVTGIPAGGTPLPPPP